MYRKQFPIILLRSVNRSRCGHLKKFTITLVTKFFLGSNNFIFFFNEVGGGFNLNIQRPVRILI